MFIREQGSNCEGLFSEAYANGNDMMIGPGIFGYF